MREPVARWGAVVCVLLLVAAGASRVPGTGSATTASLAIAAAFELSPGLVDHPNAAWTATPCFAVSVLAGPAVARLLQERSRAGRLARVAVLTSGCLLALADVVFRRRDAELHCWPFCTPNRLLVSDRPDLVHVARLLLVTAEFSWCLVLVAIAAHVGLSAHRLGGRPTSTARPAADAAVLVAMSGAMGCMVVRLARRPLVQIDSFEVRAWTAASLLLLGAAAVLAEHQSIIIRLTRRRVRVLSDDLVSLSAPGAIEATLRSAVADPRLRVTIGDGPRPRVDDGPPAGSVEVRRGEECIAIITHESDAARVRAALTPAVLTVLETRHLLDRADRELSALTDSRREVVRRGDEARRTLERDLHDGAQQRLIVLGMTLASLRIADDDPARSSIDAAIQEATQALAQLRMIARGAVPALLDELGLGEAVASMTDDLGIDLRLVGDVDDRRRTTVVDRAAYLFVAACLRDVAQALDEPIDVELVASDNELTVRCAVPANCHVEVDEAADRVIAAGGHVEHHEGRRCVRVARFAREQR
jgi:signal transduction histidine kinase